MNELIRNDNKQLLVIVNSVNFNGQHSKFNKKTQSFLNKIINSVIKIV